MAFNLLPPSPALSTCDSLAGIDDLEAFLAAQGPLSIFPTPDPRDELSHSRQTCSSGRYPLAATSGALDVTETTEERRRIVGQQPSGDASDVVLNLYAAAEAFDEKARQCGACHEEDGTSAIVELLTRANLPVELLALAYAILDTLSTKDTSKSIGDCNANLLLTAALTLADIHINDRPIHLATWSRYITTRTIEIHCLDRMTLTILESLDWTVHRLCNPAVIARYLVTLTLFAQHDYTSQRLPKLQTRDPSTALWVYGQLTPAEQSPCPAARPQSTCFLRLL